MAVRTRRNADERSASQKHRIRAGGIMATVLIVEDRDVQLEIFVAMLKSRGHEIITATNGQEAVEAAFARTPDLVIMDIDMPVMNGFDATRAIKAKLPVPIVLLSALSTDAQVNDAFDAGCDGFEQKPITKARLLAVVDEFTQGHESPS